MTLALLGLVPPSLAAQVALTPTVVEPAGWERFALRVVNQTDTATVTVRLVVPEAILVMGIDAPEGWTPSLVPATGTTPQAIEWSGGRLDRGQFREFSFFGRLEGSARPGRELVFPVRLTRANGSTVEWARGEAGAPLVARIRGSTMVSPSGAFALAGGAIGLAALALGLALAGRRRTD